MALDPENNSEKGKKMIISYYVLRRIRNLINAFSFRIRQVLFILPLVKVALFLWTKYVGSEACNVFVSNGLKPRAWVLSFYICI